MYLRAATILLCLCLCYVHTIERTYFIAVDEVTWDYAPLGKDGYTGVAFNQTEGEPVHNMGVNGMAETPATWTLPGPMQYVIHLSIVFYILNLKNRIGSLYKKALYREYTNASFVSLKNREPEWEHLGYLGPVIRAEVGDTIRIKFRNNGMRSYSMHPHGVFYDKNNEGVPSGGSMEGMEMEQNGNSVMPGMEWDYEWEVPERAGPGPSDPSSILWMYHSHVDETIDVNSGLVGPIIITRAGSEDKTTGRPIDVDREFVVMFTIINENLSWYLEDNIATYIPMNDTMDMNETMEMLSQDPLFVTSNQKHVVNGFLYSNLMGLTMSINETVRWYAMSIGDEVDLHGSHWHGQTLLYDGHRVDVIELIPASMKTLDMIPDNAGKWLLHCHTNHHIVAGMIAAFDVQPCLTPCPQNDPVSQMSSDANMNPTTSWYIIFIGMAFSLLIMK